MSPGERIPTLPELRQALLDEFGPRVRVRRGHEGALFLRIISERFEAEAAPFELVQSVLAARGLTLPEPTLAVLKAPADLEPGEEALLLGAPEEGTPTWADALVLEPEAPPSPRPSPCRTIAFWGLKGGVGRTTALAHVATLLGRRQVILALDLDLDSPGLVGTLAQEDRRNGRPRFDDLLRRAGEESVSLEALQADVKRALRRGQDSASRVYVLGPEQADIPFVTDLAGPLTPSALYRGHGPTLRRFVDIAVQAAGADLLLLDARSGYADESAMAVLDLADEVVLFASPSPSTYPSLTPAIEALERSRRARGRPRLVHFVSGMLPGNEEVRRRVVSDLVALAESVEARISEELATPVEERPPSLVPVLIDYTARIVENDGVILKDVLAGYGELAERIQPAPLRLPAPSLTPDWAATVIDEVCSFFEQHPPGAPETEDLLFIEPLSLRDFVPESLHVIIGSQGAAGIGNGKSALRRSLLRRPANYQHQMFQAATPFSVTFIPAYFSATGTEAPSLLSRALLERLRAGFAPDATNLQETAGRWKAIWSALLPWLLVRALHLEIPQPGVSPVLKRLLDSRTEDDVLAALPDLLDAPDAQQSGIDLVRRQAWDAQKTWLLLFDDIDLLFGRSPEAARDRQAAVGGLLACEATSVRRSIPSNSQCLLFCREDTLLEAHQAAAVVEGRELRLWTHDIPWTWMDSLRLILRTLSVASPAFAEASKQFGGDVGRLNDSLMEPLSDLLRLLWGERMDEREGRLRVTSWLQIRLQDAGARHFPGPALSLLRHAFSARRRAPTQPSLPLLDPGTLRAVLPDIADARLAELRRAATDLELASLQALRGQPNLEDPERLRRALLDAGAPPDAFERLVYLGVLGGSGARETSGRYPRVRVADLYALAPSLGIRRVHR